MFRFFKFFLRPDYEECKGCEILKHQLRETNQEKKDLLELVMSLVRPTPAKIEPREAQISKIPIIPKNMTWSRRRAMLEERDRIETQLRKNSPFMASPVEREEYENNKDREESVAALEREVAAIEKEVNPNASEIG